MKQSATTSYLLTIALAALIWGGWSMDTLCATDYPVSSPQDIRDAMAVAVPGDTLTMTAGIWRDADILFKGDGSETAPILLRAEIPGRVVLTGRSRLRIAGSFLVADGLYFKDGQPPSGGVVEFRENSGNTARRCRLTNSAIVDYNPGGVNTDYKWVSLYGDSNRVDHCYLAGKTHSGTTLVVWLTNRANYHRIDHNWFGPRPELGFNGGETIRVGTSDWSMQDSYTIVESNYFERCNGEVEIISNKSGRNTFRYNTFVECNGALTLRHGNFAHVEANFFLGNGGSSTGGVRVIGEDHVVINNYFQDLYGSSSRNPLSIMNGVPNSPLNRYFQVKRARILYNTFANCRNPIVIGLGADSERTLPPLDCIIANNLVHTDNSSQIIEEEDQPINLVYDGNIMFGSPLGIPADPGIRELDPLLAVAADGLWRPQTGSPAIDGAAGTYPEAVSDMDGQPRDGSPDVGADEQSGAPVVIRPLTPADVGPAWYPPAVRIQQVAPGRNTLRDAIDNALPGDILELDDGVYENDGPLEIRFPLTLRPAAGASTRPVLRQVEATSGERVMMRLLNGAHLRLDGLDLDGDRNGSTPVTDLLRATAPMSDRYVVRATDCRFRDADSTVLRAETGTTADSLVFIDCLFSGMGGEAFRLREEAAGSGEFNVDWFQLTHCTFWDIAREAAHLYSGDAVPFTPGPRVRIDHCTFDRVGSAGFPMLSARDCDAAQVRNSIFSNGSTDTTSMVLEGLITSLAWSDTFAVGPVALNRGAEFGPGMVGLDPLYADPLVGDFTLDITSPVLTLADDGSALGDRRWDPTPTAIDPRGNALLAPETMVLEPNWPNPFNPETRLAFSLGRTSRILLAVYNLRGQRIATLVEGVRPAGRHEVTWRPAGLASGIYLLHLTSGAHVATRKLVLLK